MNKKKKSDDNQNTLNLVIVIGSIIGLFLGVLYIKVNQSNKEKDDITISVKTYEKSFREFSKRFKCDTLSETMIHSYVQKSIEDMKNQ